MRVKSRQSCSISTFLFISDQTETYVHILLTYIYLFLFDRRNSKKVVCRELTTLRATINLEGKPIPISTWNINTTKMKCVPFSPLYPWQPFVTTAICYFQKRKRSKGTRVGCHKSITCETTTTTLLIVAPSPLLWSGRKIFRWERLRRNMS